MAKFGNIVNWLNPYWNADYNYIKFLFKLNIIIINTCVQKSTDVPASTKTSKQTMGVFFARNISNSSKTAVKMDIIWINFKKKNI